MGRINHFNQTCLNEDEDCNNGAVSVKSPHAINRPRLQKRIWMFLGNPRRSVTIEMAGHMQPTYGKVQGGKKSHVRGAENTDWATCLPPSLCCSCSSLESFTEVSANFRTRGPIMPNICEGSYQGCKLNPHCPHQLPHFCILSLVKAPVPALSETSGM